MQVGYSALQGLMKLMGGASCGPLAPDPLASDGMGLAGPTCALMGWAQIGRTLPGQTWTLMGRTRQAGPGTISKQVSKRH